CFSTDSVDYPDFAHQLAQSIDDGSNDLGIQFCGSGNGINMSANKHQSIRSALCWEVEIAELARLHNDANVCTMPARFISLEKALSIIDVFLNTDFEGGRHQRRVDKISC
ncbi:MAG TPA: ribose-5-phosphate isomerase, partial [Flavobacteriales bacterium]|nr:ribose-5-phosphate isomerase [Flavobacteriales bacterium]